MLVGFFRDVGDVDELVMKKVGAIIGAPGHRDTATSFGPYNGLQALQETVTRNLKNAPPGSYTARLGSEKGLLAAKLVTAARSFGSSKSRKRTCLFFVCTRNYVQVSSANDEENRNVCVENFSYGTFRNPRFDKHSRERVRVSL